MTKITDMTGLRFGSWTVTGPEYVINSKGNKVLKWISVCDCGRTELVFGTALRGGRSTRCRPCGDRSSSEKRSVYDDLTGKTFGTWTVTGRVESIGSGARYSVVCQNGHTLMKNGHVLVGGKASTCRKCVDLPDGVKRTTSDGYVKIKMKSHPNSRRGWLLEHTYVMSEYLGRPLTKGENVHHKNGVRSDNRLENLELWIVSQPYGQRAGDVLKWAREIINTYEGEEKEIDALEDGFGQ